MKPKKDEWLLTAIFCGFLGVMLVLYLFGPKNSFSVREKRYLAPAPTLNGENLLSGNFSQALEDYMADHMPGRDFFVGLHAYAGLLSGRQLTSDIYVTTDGRLIEAPVSWNDDLVQKNMRAIHRFAGQSGAAVSLMVVPSAGWTVGGHLIGPGDRYPDAQQLQSLYALAAPEITTLDLTEVYCAQPDPGSLYYRTDHHWTSLGAYLAYTAWCQSRGLQPRAQADFTVEAVDGFYGSTYARSALWLTRAEPLELWHGASGITVSNADTPGTHDGPFYRERLAQADKYTVFLDGNHALVRLHNPAGQGKLLVIRDSFSNCLGAFLAENYEEVILVDLRYYKQPVSGLLEQAGISDVLICYSLHNFLTDNNLIWLR